MSCKSSGLHQPAGVFTTMSSDDPDFGPTDEEIADDFGEVVEYAALGYAEKKIAEHLQDKIIAGNMAMSLGPLGNTASAFGGRYYITTELRALVTAVSSCTTIDFNLNDRPCQMIMPTGNQETFITVDADTGEIIRCRLAGRVSSPGEFLKQFAPPNPYAVRMFGHQQPEPEPEPKPTDLRPSRMIDLE